MNTNTEFIKNTSISIEKPENNFSKGINYPELVRAATPILIAMFGCIIGLSAILLVDNNDANANKFTAAMGLAGTAIAGASGLAQSNKKDE